MAATVYFQAIEPGTINFGRMDCINNHRDYHCPNTATIEAVAADNRGNTARVRCCVDQKCMERARTLALASI